MICASCGSNNATRRCTRCKEVAYCNVSCQQAHWKKEHKQTCQRKDDGDGSILSEDVTLTLRHEYDDRGEFRAFTSITVDILVKNQNAGKIEGVLVNRMIIPPGQFLSAMDGHSHEMQMIASAVYEPRMGRTKLISLRDGGDVYGNGKDILYIESIHIKEQYKEKNCSDVGALAIRKLLRHKVIKGDISRGGIWCGISSCVYILEPTEAMPKEVRERYEAEQMNNSWYRREVEESLEAKLEREAAAEQRQLLRNKYARLDANQFLRNGFYQDEAVAKDVDSFIIMAATNHWKGALQSHSKVANIKLMTPEDCNEGLPPSPIGKDAGILEITKRICSSGLAEGMDESMGTQRAASYRNEVSQLISDGGSLVNSHALHAASALNDIYVAKTILDMDASTLESRDVHNATPLFLAAAYMAGQSNNSGFPSEHPMIDMLLDAGADKDATNSEGLTAYGTFKSYNRNYQQSTQAMMGNAVFSDELMVPGQAALEMKFMPNGGPTAADLSYGEGADRGYVEFNDDY